jgi:3-phosphoshikimate 1-carboxyvinyltransferase
MVQGLKANGANIDETEDSMSVHGNGPGSLPGGGTAAARLDHRIAMSFMIAGMGAQKPVSVDDAGPIATSFPIFEPLMAQLGAKLLRNNHG